LAAPSTSAFGGDISGVLAVSAWSASLAEEVDLVRAPTAPCTAPVGASRVVGETVANEVSCSVGNDDEIVVDNGNFDPDCDVDADDDLAERLGGLSLSVDGEPDEFDESAEDDVDEEPGSDGSASATPGMVATADPTPSATANAPTRPMWLR
jgi:hypothetical protein